MVQRLRIAIDDRDAGAIVDHHLGAGIADAIGAAGDDGDGTLNVKELFELSLRPISWKQSHAPELGA